MTMATPPIVSLTLKPVSHRLNPSRFHFICGLHRVRLKGALEARRTVLPPDLFEQCFK